MFAIGDKEWPGISKLVEEAGEVGQVAGKLMGTGGHLAHWDGTNLARRLEEEMGDVLAAVNFVLMTCDEVSAQEVRQRAEYKLTLFMEWHKEQRHE